ncbi:MAG: DUF3592 domain-containing protein [Lachnospiraceae bacterium]|nr:DUF3592 domain-containing protein [Lachnospiraceae bacterium]
MKKYSEYSLFSIFGFVGIVILFVGFYQLIKTTTFNKTAVSTTATITDIKVYDSGDDTEHQVFVSYEFEGQTYENIQLNGYSSTMHEGKEITVYLDPDSPTDVRIKSMEVLATIMLFFMGILFFLIGFFGLFNKIKAAHRKKYLLANGKVLSATVDNIYRNTGYKVNGKSPFIVECKYMDENTGTTYRFKSENIWTNPNNYLEIGSPINVYVDYEDYSKHYVDTENTGTGKIVDFT